MVPVLSFEECQFKVKFTPNYRTKVLSKSKDKDSGKNAKESYLTVG